MSRRSRARQSVPDAPRPALPAAPSPTRDLMLSIAAAAVLFLVLVRCIVPVSPNLYFDGDPRQAVTFADDDAPADPQTSPGDAATKPKEKANESRRTAARAVPTLTLGPAGAAWLDALSLAVAGCVLIVHGRCGGAVRWLDAAMIAIGGIFAAIHLHKHIDNIYIAGGWIGAAALALATLHLAQHAAARRWFVAALVAMAVPLLIDAASYVFVEHVQTLEEFKKNEEAFLKARSWTRGSPEHELFVRRMTLGEPTGAFAFSNVLGSVAAMLAALSAVWAWGLFVSVKSRKLAILPAILAVAAAVTVVLTTSKGAPVALIMAMAVACAAAAAVWRSKQTLLRFLPAAGVAMIAFALAVVMVRGAMGPPEDDKGERSLLFRWHYWQASARIATSGADTLILGAGPNGFSEAYPAAKNPLNPEEVRSAHSTFIDWIVLLGVGGWAWSAIALSWFWNAGKAAGAVLAAMTELDEVDRPSEESENAETKSQPESQPETQGNPALTPALSRGERGPEGNADPNALTKPADVAASDSASVFDVPLRDLILALALIAALFGFEAAVKFESLLIPERFLPWAGGLMAFLFVTAVASNPRWLPPRWLPLALFVAAAVLLIHNQIEMSFYQPSSAPLAWFVLALAAGGNIGSVESLQPACSGPLAPGSVPRVGERVRVRGSQIRAQPYSSSGSPLFSALPGALLLIFAILFAAAIAGPVTREQRLLAEAADELRLAGGSRGGYFRAMDLLAQASVALPTDPKPYEWRSRLSLEAASHAKQFLATNPPPQVRTMVAGEMRQLTQQAIATLAQAADRGLDTQSLHRQRAVTLVHAADLLNEPRYLEEALTLWQQLIVRRPYVWQDRTDLADLLWRMNHREEAREHYRRALELSDLLYLDPARQMGKDDRAYCEERSGR